MDEDLDETLNAAGVKYIIRGRTNTEGTIIRAFADNGQEIPQLKGKKVSDVPKWMNVDLDVKTSKGNTLRIPHRINLIQRIKIKSPLCAPMLKGMN